MKYLLHIDTSGDTGCVAIAADGAAVSVKTNAEARNHASSINLMIADALADCGITMAQLAGVVVCAGPGSYTGLRIGLSTAKGICYALDLPLLMDNKLTLLAYQAWINTEKAYDHYTAILVAREKEYFISVFNKQFENILPAKHIMDNELPELLEDKKNNYLIMDQNSNEIAEKQNISTNTIIDINLWVSYSLEQFKCNNTVNLSTSEPFYLKQVYTHK